MTCFDYLRAGYVYKAMERLMECVGPRDMAEFVALLIDKRFDILIGLFWHQNLQNRKEC